VIFLLLVFAAGVVWQAMASSAETRSNPPPGELVDVGGRSMHLYCLGERVDGSPTVILEGGVPEWSIHWSAVQPEIARFTRVCSYDRSGYGWSEPGPEPRTAGQIVQELHTLLANAGEEGPYVLAAHSFWGPAALLYQRQYPVEVAGMVLIETWSPDLFASNPAVIQQSLPLADSLAKIAPMGLLRLFSRAGVLPLDEMLQVNLLPVEVQTAYRSAAFSGQMWNTLSDEYRAMEESAAQVEDLDSLGDLPLVVIRAGQRLPGDYPPEETWQQTQEQLARLSTNGRLVVAGESGHFVQLEQPDLVAETIQEVIEQAR
jgi:pimeloyl-ACP methyl ester carboxylesterase